ncbi:MAG: hypothetical protein ACTHMB_08835 [Candidatus Binatia bacterium]
MHWQIDTPKNQPHSARVDVLLHVASPGHQIDPALNGLKQNVIEALLNSVLDQRVRANGFEYKMGLRTRIGQMQKNKTTQAFKVLLSPSQAKRTYRQDIEVVHAAVREDVDQILRPFGGWLTRRFGR